MSNAFRIWRHSLYARISGVFVGLLAFSLLSGLGIWLILWDQFTDYSEQYLNWSIARQIEVELKGVLAAPIDAIRLKGRLDELSNLNPRFDIYLIDAEGKLLVWNNRIAKTSVDLEPIKQFLETKEPPYNPIYGDNPPERAGHTNDKVIFSVAPTTIGGQPGYVYVTLKGATFVHVYSVIGENRFLHLSLLWLGTALAALAIIGLALFRLITRRFQTMTLTVENFADGDYEKRLVISTEDEVGRLARAFNSMADTIENNIRSLEHNDGLRRNLVANVSHDLRGPLTCIQGFLQMLILEHSERFDEPAVRYIEVIGKNVAHLRKLADALFELSKLEAKDALPALEMFSIEELANDVVLKFGPQAQELGITLGVVDGPDLEEVYADSVLIERVLSNLVDNALRHTPPGGSITIELHRAGARIRVRVRDTGSGIPQEDIPFLFERFYRVEKHRSKKTGGSGLGLAIVKRILEAHEETITVHSVLSEGTTLEFHLPVASRSNAQETSAQQGM